MDPVSELKGKEIKRACLNELVDYIASGRGVLTEAVYPKIIEMVSLGHANALKTNAILVHCLPAKELAVYGVDFLNGCIGCSVFQYFVSLVLSSQPLC